MYTLMDRHYDDIKDNAGVLSILEKDTIEEDSIQRDRRRVEEVITRGSPMGRRRMRFESKRKTEMVN